MFLLHDEFPLTLLDTKVLPFDPGGSVDLLTLRSFGTAYFSRDRLQLHRRSRGSVLGTHAPFAVLKSRTASLDTRSAESAPSKRANQGRTEQQDRSLPHILAVGVDIDFRA